MFDIFTFTFCLQERQLATFLHQEHDPNKCPFLPFSPKSLTRPANSTLLPSSSCSLSAAEIGATLAPAENVPVVTLARWMYHFDIETVQRASDVGLSSRIVVFGDHSASSRCDHNS